jgi:hypothetical protein
MVCAAKGDVAAVFDGAMQPEPGSVLPMQYLDSRKKLAPEARLMIAVLQNAINCLEKYRLTARPLGRQLFDEEKQWFLAPGGDWPYSFEHICAAPDLDADAVRESIRLALRPSGRITPMPRRSMTRVMQRMKSESVNANDWDEV